MQPQPRASLTLARIMGPLFLAIGAALIADYPRFLTSAETFIQDDGFLMLGAFMALLMGLIILALHGYWRTPTQILMSLMGVIMIVRGVLLLFMPGLAEDIFAFFVANPQVLPIIGCVMALLGLWLIVFSFIAPPEDGLGYFGSD